MEKKSVIMECLKRRRSVRKFKSKPLPLSLVLEVLEAARWAPSAHNAQPWRFIVIRDKEVKERLARAMARKWVEDMLRDGVPEEIAEKRASESIERFMSAPVLIVACLTMEDMDKYPDEVRQRAEYLMAVQSVASAIQNLLLAAHAAGLGACWYCAPLFCPEVVREILKIPPQVDPQALITLGFPDEEPEPPPRLPLNLIVQYESWRE